MSDKKREFQEILDKLTESLKDKVNPETNETFTSEEIHELAVAQFKREYGENPEESASDWHRIEYFVPIMESTGSNGEFLIKGTAINATTTRNGVTYLAEELEPAAPTLRNQPLLKDHVNSVDFIVGRTTNNIEFNKQKKRIDFEAKVIDQKMQEMIRDGRIDSVSIGAMVHEIEETEGGDVIARGIEFVELSLVAVPADKKAGFAKAMMESFDLKKKIEPANAGKKEVNDPDPKIGDDNVEEKMEKEEFEKIQAENAKMAEKIKDYEAKEAEVAKEKAIQDEVEKRISEDAKKVLVAKIMKKDSKISSEELMKKTIEELEDDAKEPDPVEDKTKGGVGSDADNGDGEDAAENLHIEREGNNFSLSFESYDTEKYPRLGYGG